MAKGSCITVRRLDGAKKETLSAVVKFLKKKYIYTIWIHLVNKHRYLKITHLQPFAIGDCPTKIIAI